MQPTYVPPLRTGSRLQGSGNGAGQWGGHTGAAPATSRSRLRVQATEERKEVRWRETRLIFLQGHQGRSVENKSVVKAVMSDGRLLAPVRDQGTWTPPECGEQRASGDADDLRGF